MTLERIAVVLALVQAGAPEGEVRSRADPPTAVFWAEANYVEVDAVVTDPNGYTVRGLTRDDFEILEEGVPQEIATFTEVALPMETAPARPEVPGAVEPPPPRQMATNEEGLEGRIYVLVLDALHTDPRRSSSVRKAARRFVDEHMTDGDIAAVVYTDGRTDAAQTFTSDRSLLRASIERFTGRKLESAVLERQGLIERADGPSSILPLDAQRVADARTAMEILGKVAGAIGEVRGRPKAVLFFSEGSSFDTLDTAHDSQRTASDVFEAMKTGRDAADVAAALRDAIASAVGSHVAVYAIDPRGLSAPRGAEDMEMGGAPATPLAGGLSEAALDRELRRAHHGLHTLAEETGGFASLSTNDFGSSYERIVRANSRYYLLGYYPADFRRDGKHRRIEVRVRGPGLTVAARDGYRRPLGEDEAPREGRAAAPDETSPELRELLERPWSQPGLTLGVAAAAFRGAAGASQVAVTVEVPGASLPFAQEGDRAVNEQEAAKLFGRALEADPSLLEARIRLGRVLHLLGRADDARRELRGAVESLGGVPAAEDAALLAYYAELFLGATEEELRRHDAARAAYARAAALHPDAPSPRLSLSHLAFQAGDRAGALDQLRAGLEPARQGPDRDPWWRYHIAPGRSVDERFRQLHASLP